MLGPRKCLGMDGLDGITLQIDALNLWNCSQSVGLQVRDAILTFTQQDYITYKPVSIWKEPSSDVRRSFVFNTLT